MKHTDRLIEWHRSELKHINTVLETRTLKKREHSRYDRRRRGHETTLLALHRLKHLEAALKELNT